MQDGSNTNAGRDALERRAEATPTDGAAEWSEAPLAEIERPKERSRGVRLVLLAARLIFMALILSMPVLVVASARRGDINWLTIFGLMLASGALGQLLLDAGGGGVALTCKTGLSQQQRQPPGFEAAGALGIEAGLRERGAHGIPARLAE